MVTLTILSPERQHQPAWVFHGQNTCTLAATHLVGFNCAPEICIIH